MGLNWGNRHQAGLPASAGKDSHPVATENSAQTPYCSHLLLDPSQAWRCLYHAPPFTIFHPTAICEGKERVLEEAGLVSEAAEEDTTKRRHMADLPLFYWMKLKLFTGTKWLERTLTVCALL